jgi:regulator of protease activity HflC (stomatin/prohibitin superfamily)
MSTVAIIIFLAIFLTATATMVWVLLQDAFIQVKPGEMGLVITRGKPAKTGLYPGTHFALRFGRVIEIYPAVEITYLTAPDANTSPADDSLTLYDPPLHVALGDRTSATVHYTVRFNIMRDGLPTIHTRFGTTGLKGILRDETRRVLITIMGDASVTAADTLGARRADLETRIADTLAEKLAAAGFTLVMFNLREIDLAGTTEVIQSTLRAAEELQLERARGAVRALRAEQEVAINEKLAGSLTGPTLEYLRMQATRDLIDRWDGKFLTAPGAPPLVPPDGAPQPAQPQPAAPPPESDQPLL